MAEPNVSRRDLNTKPEEDNGGSSDDEVQIVHETKAEDPEVRIIGQVASPEATFIPRGHSTILHSTDKKMQPFFISTKERRQQMKLKPGFITEKLKGQFGARQKFEASPGSWRTENLHSMRPTFKRRFKAASPKGTPRGAFGSAVRMDDYQMYARILNHSNEQSLIDLTKRPTSPSRTPLFARSPPIQRSVMRDQTSSQALIDQMKKHQKPRKKPVEVVTLEDRPRIYESASDKDVIEIIDVVSPPKSPKAKKSTTQESNTLAKEYELYDVCHPDYLKILSDKYDKRKEDNEILIKEQEVAVEHFAERRDKLAKSVEERMRRHLSITEVAIPEPEEEESSEDEEDTELPEITDEMEAKITSILSSSPSQTLVDAHNIPITRKDLDTLRGLNWLNDEIINFYLQMIVARSKENDNWPNVYAMNTFFLPKLMKTGFDAIKRWTRKMDIFSFDIILVPVHLDVHWCLALINLKKKCVNFYDSMGSDKNDILKALLNYLEKEHMHKKNSPFDTSDFTLENVKEIPKQMNGSDCGMFTLKYAEYLSRNASITFTQEDMPYFRRRMVYEIVNNRVIHP